MTGERLYPFSWELLGDIQLGRPNLGPKTELAVYRLMQFTFRDVIEQKFDTQTADEIFYDAGKLAGSAFFQHVINPVEDLNEFIQKTQSVLKEMNIGILRVEKADLEKLKFTLTVSEDLDCSGLPELGHSVCTYDEGFIAALMESFYKRGFQAKEIDCWCTGDRTCRFEINPT
jgi:predicted hydrocarbon binding protein